MSVVDELKEAVRKRVALIKGAEDVEALRKCVCPFFELGGHPDCSVCLKEEEDVQACRDEYLEKIVLHPQDMWTPAFDVVTYKKRDKVPAEELTGIGVNCNFCYMSDKCPIYARDSVCGIQWDNNKPETAKDFMDFLISTQFERVRRASVFEKIDGGVPDANLSGEMDRLRDYVRDKGDLDTSRLSINVEAKSPASAGGGILAQIFGKPSAALPVDEQPALPPKEAAPILIEKDGQSKRKKASAKQA